MINRLKCILAILAVISVLHYQLQAGLPSKKGQLGDSRLEYLSIAAMSQKDNLNNLNISTSVLEMSCYKVWYSSLQGSDIKRFLLVFIYKCISNYQTFTWIHYICC